MEKQELLTAIINADEEINTTELVQDYQKQCQNECNIKQQERTREQLLKRWAELKANVDDYSLDEVQLLVSQINNYHIEHGEDLINTSSSV